MKKLNEAAEEYKKILEIDPNFFETRHSLGNVLATQAANLINKGKVKEGWKKLKEAKSELESALKLNPDSAGTLELIEYIENTQKTLQSRYPDLK